MTQIEIIKALSDNYIYVLHNPINKQTAVIDPGEAQPVIELLEKKGWKLSHIFNTHHHEDHIGGNQKLIDKYNCKLIAPKYDQNRIRNCDHYVLDGDEIDIIGKKGKVFYTPGHTIGHICYYIESLKILFSGDTLFRLGCGRIFEGTFEQMKDSLDKILNLPDDILVYCGHEYTMTNANFCKSLIYNNDEGGISIITPADNCELSLAQIIDKDVPNGKSYTIVPKSEVPTDRSFRNAWTYTP